MNLVLTFDIKCNHGYTAYTLSCRFNYMTDNKTLKEDLPHDFREYAKHVTQLTLGISNLTTMPDDLFTMLPNLHTLTARADIKTITKKQFINANHLIMLNFGYNNQLSKLEMYLFKYASQLEYIDFGFNQIDEIEGHAFDGLMQLEKLNLEANLIQSLTNETFHGADNVEILELSRNQISEIDEGTFLNMSKLRKLHLNRNLLR